jgi:hypothetical protein
VRQEMMIFLLACCSLRVTAQPEVKAQNPREPQISEFAVSGVPAIQALLTLSRNENVPLGIVADDDHLCRSQVTYSGVNVTLADAVKSIVAQVPGYTGRRVQGSSILLVGPAAPRPVTSQFLSLVDKRYGPISARVPELIAALWVQVRYILHPDQGNAGSILSSLDDPIFQVEARDATIEDILNRIAIASGEAWVLRPLPAKLDEVGAEMPFAIYGRFGWPVSSPAQMCNPVIVGEIHK